MVAMPDPSGLSFELNCDGCGRRMTTGIIPNPTGNIKDIDFNIILINCNLCHTNNLLKDRKLDESGLPTRSSKEPIIYNDAMQHLKARIQVDNYEYRKIVVNTDMLLDVAATLRKNIQRILDLSTLPTFLVALASSLTQAREQLKWDTFGTFDEANSPENHTILSRKLTEWVLDFTSMLSRNKQNEILVTYGEIRIPNICQLNP